MNIDNARWSQLKGGYRLPYDPREAIGKLARGDATAWEELWQELHHQGDVDEASYAAVPQLVRLRRESGEADWNIYALVATIEDARHHEWNPSIPDWLLQDYQAAWVELELLALSDFPQATARELVQGIIAVLALSKGRLTLAKMAFLTEDERQEMLKAYGTF